MHIYLLHRCHIGRFRAGCCRCCQLLLRGSELVECHVELRLCAVEPLDMHAVDDPCASWRVYDMVWVIAPGAAFKLLLDNLRMIFRVHLRLVTLWQAEIRQGIGAVGTPVNQDSAFQHNGLIQAIEQGLTCFHVYASPGAICIGFEVLFHVVYCQWGHRFLLWGYMPAKEPLSKVAFDRTVIVNRMPC